MRLESLIALRQGAWLLPESSIDPRKLGRALEKAARTLGVDFVTGTAVTEIAVLGRRATGVRTAKSFYAADKVVNCAGAWAGEIKPLGIPTRPVKGQIACLVPQAAGHNAGPLIQHVIRTAEVYIIPRSDGRILLGATVEEAGFDKRVDPDTVRHFQEAAAKVVPALAEMRLHEAWAGLRPGSPDELPILGETALTGILRGDRALSRRDYAGAGDRVGHDAIVDRTSNPISIWRIFAVAVRVRLGNATLWEYDIVGFKAGVPGRRVKQFSGNSKSRSLTG